MAESVSTLDVRQRIGDLLNRVALRRDEFVIERKGKRLAALVPVERLDQMRRLAQLQVLDVLASQRGGPLTDRDATALSVEAKAQGRQRRRTATRPASARRSSTRRR